MELWVNVALVNSKTDLGLKTGVEHLFHESFNFQNEVADRF